MTYFLIYLAIISVITFVAFGLDKQYAKRNARRIPEKTLISMAAAGGAFGALLGMRFFRHKTLKPTFRFGIPLLFVVYAIAVTYMWL